MAKNVQNLSRLGVKKGGGLIGGGALNGEFTVLNILQGPNSISFLTSHCFNETAQNEK